MSPNSIAKHDSKSQAHNSRKGTNKVPVSPRILSTDERRKKDVYSFRSPKLDRVTELVGCLNAAQALFLEFDPSTSIYVERPRTLPLRDREVELHFWTRDQEGLERYWLMVPASETADRDTSRRRYRDEVAIVESAQRAHIGLNFIYESDVQRQAATLATWHRVLPYVQTALDLPHRSVISARVLQVFDSLDRSCFSQIESFLTDFHPADIRATTCWLIHQGRLRLTDPSKLTGLSVIECRRDGHDHGK